MNAQSQAGRSGGGVALLALVLCAGCSLFNGPPHVREEVKAPPPAWVVTHRDDRFPDRLYLTGVGEATSGYGEAEAQARTDLAKRIEVQIEGQDRFMAVEATEGGYRYSVKSEVHEEVNVKLVGLGIEDRWSDPGGKRFYALAVLSRAKAAVPVRGDLEVLVEDAHAVHNKAREWEAREEPLRAAASYTQLQGLLGEIQTLRRRYLVLRGDEPETRPLSQVPSVVEINQRLDELLASIRLVSIGGDGQRATHGRPLERPLTIKAVSRFGGKDTPLRDVGIAFAFDQGQGQVDRMGRTDLTGLASTAVREVRPAADNATVVAKLDVDGLMTGMAARWRERVTDAVQQSRVVFTIIPPRVVQTGTDPMTRAIGQLGETLLSRFDFDDKARPSIAVLDFVETYGNQRLPLSRRLENGLSTALAQWDFITVVQRDVPSSAVKPSEKAVAMGVEHYVDGMYAFSRDAVTVNASLRKVADGTTRAAGSVTIPREALTPEDLQGVVDRSQLTPSGIVIAPTEAPLTYDQFLGRLVMLHQSTSPFQVKVWTDKPSYAVGDKVTFFMEAERDCYLTLIDIGTSGNLTVLFPNAQERNNRIQGGRRYEIPGARYGFDIRVGGPPGIERVKVIATTQPFTLFENMEFPKGFFELTRNGTGSLPDMRPSSRSVAPTQWSDAAIEILILETGRSEPRGRGLVEQTKMRGMK